MKKLCAVLLVLTLGLLSTSCGSSKEPVAMGEAEFLREIVLVRDDKKVAPPWKISDLEALGITAPGYYDSQTFLPNRMEDNVDMLLDGEYRSEGLEMEGAMSPSDMVIVHAYNLTDSEAPFADMTLNQIILNPGSGAVSFNETIYVGAKISDITKQYGVPKDQNGSSYSYSLKRVDASVFGGNGKNDTLDVYLWLQEADGLVKDIRFEIRGQVY